MYNFQIYIVSNDLKSIQVFRNLFICILYGNESNYSIEKNTYKQTNLFC